MIAAPPTYDLDRCVAAFESAWASGSSPDPQSFLDSVDPRFRETTLLELLRVELELRWSRGERNLLEQFRQRYRELFANREAVAILAFEEFRQRASSGEMPDRREYERRFGISTDNWPESEMMPRTEILCDAKSTSAQFPKTGESVGPYRIAGILGRGSFGRVYLAEETDLSNRRVALKLSTRFGRFEPEILARLQHTNIVPVYSASKIGPFQSTVMPFFGATTVADLLDSIRDCKSRPQSGRSILDTIATKRGSTIADEPLTPSSDTIAVSPLGEMLSSFRYPDAILWMVARLADALNHAHTRGIVHRDIKPANILLTDDGVPMLLDFNLAVTDDRPAAWGGTPAYMAPELMDKKVKADAKSDLYSLGAVACELLTGKRPTESEPFPIRNSTTSAAIIRKCLERDPTKRFTTAKDLSEEIDRHLRFDPLRTIREPSWKERLSKWTKRHPRLSSSAFVSFMAGVILIGTAFAAIGWRAQSQHLKNRNVASQAFITFQAEVPGLLNSMSMMSDSKTAQSDAVNRITQWNECLGDPGDRDWGSKGLVSHLDADNRKQIAWDLGLVNLLTARQESNNETAKQTYNRVIAGFKQSGRIPKSVWEEWKSRYGATNPDNTVPDNLVTDSWSHCLKGIDDYQRGRFREAAESLDEATRIDPGEPWAWLALGNARFQLGDWFSAEGAFQAYLVLRPHEPMGYYNRGLARIRLKQFTKAISDFDCTLEIVPEHRHARYQRGLTKFSLNRWDEARHDFDHLINDEPDVRTLLARARVFTKLGQHDAAGRDRKWADLQTPESEVDFISRGMDRAERNLLAEAIADFDSALKLNPRSFAALQNKAHVLDSRLHNEPEAIRALTAVIALYPNALESRIGRAVLFARQNRRSESHDDARYCLDHRPNAEIVYQVANVYALTSRTNLEDREIALRHLSSALHEGFGHDLLDADPDLAPIRETPEFLSLLDAARTIRNGLKKDSP